MAGQALGQRGTRQADARPQLEHVDGADELAEHTGCSPGGMQLRSSDLEQGRLAGAVGPQDHPALSVTHHPGDPVQQERLAATDSHVGELEDRGHGDHHRRLATVPCDQSDTP